ncbi:MAG TPA: hypothetical protein VMT93_05055 [Gemmatimonadaceae bacterium]|nr:hypothetical protein [Gemmatimonadaceae bacterium]
MGSEPDAPLKRAQPDDAPPCELCGGETWWRNCKLLCKRCGTILRTCADL